MDSWRDHANQVEVAVAFKDSLGSEPEEVWAISLGAAPSGPEEFEDDLLAILPRDAGEIPYVLNSRRTSHTWGADFASWQYMLEVASGFAKGTIEGLIAAQFINWWQASRAKARDTEPLSRDSAQNEAEWAILLAYDTVRRDDLQLVAEQHDRGANAWTFEMTAPGHHFTVEVGSIGGIPWAVKLRCRFADNGDAGSG
jgi:hypothetical protein